MAAAQACVALVVVCFFLPWVHVSLAKAKQKPQQARHWWQPKPKPANKLDYYLNETMKGIGHGTKGLDAVLADGSGVPRRISGVRIPQLVNSNHSKTMMQLVEMFTHKKEHLGVKSYLVYALPGLALLLGALLTKFGALRWVSLSVVALCLAVAAEGVWQLLTIKMEAPVIAIRFAAGLWLSLLGYVGIAFGAAGMVWPRLLGSLGTKIAALRPHASPSAFG